MGRAPPAGPSEVLRSEPSALIGRWSVDFVITKRPARTPSGEKTLTSFPFPFLCLTRSRSDQMTFAGGEEGRRREPPRRRACSPLAEHAAVERLHGRCLAPARVLSKPVATEGSPAGYLTTGGGLGSDEVGYSTSPFPIHFLCLLIHTG
jgi:hypothetical protein